MLALANSCEEVARALVQEKPNQLISLTCLLDSRENNLVSTMAHCKLSLKQRDKNPWQLEEGYLANNPQARKRARQANVHRSRNMSHRAKFRTFVKRVEAQVASGDYEAASAAFKAAEPIIDSMVNRNLIHKNKAARHKSRLNRKIKLLAPQS